MFHQQQRLCATDNSTGARYFFSSTVQIDHMPIQSLTSCRCENFTMYTLYPPPLLSSLCPQARIIVLVPLQILTYTHTRLPHTGVKSKSQGSLSTPRYYRSTGCSSSNWKSRLVVHADSSNGESQKVCILSDFVSEGFDHQT